MPDSLSDQYADLLTGSYDCVDRIVLNGYFRMGHDPGGFRLWWRALMGSDETLDNTHLMRLAGRFSRRVRGYAKANGVPVVDCPIGERKHELAEEYLAKTKITQGLFLILVGRAQAPVWDVGANHHLERKKPYVNHYSFHILDPEWGHITIKISGHPPFPAQVMLNGHEYVACQARKSGISFTKEGNCFTHISDAAGLAKIRHLVRATDCRAAESGLRALDLYHLLVFRARPGGAEAKRVSLPVFQLSGGVQPQPDLRDRRAHGPGVSGADRPQSRAAGPENR